MKTNNCLIFILLWYFTFAKSDKHAKDCNIKRRKLEKMMKKQETDKKPTEDTMPKNR